MVREVVLRTWASKCGYDKGLQNKSSIRSGLFLIPLCCDWFVLLFLLCVCHCILLLYLILGVLIINTSTECCMCAYHVYMWQSQVSHLYMSINNSSTQLLWSEILYKARSCVQGSLIFMLLGWESHMTGTTDNRACTYMYVCAMICEYLIFDSEISIWSKGGRYDASSKLLKIINYST